MLWLASLKVADEDRAGHTAVAVVRVFLVNSFQVGIAARLLREDRFGNRNHFLFAVVSVLQEGGAPAVATHSPPRDVDRGGSQLAGKVMEKVVREERTVENVARQLNNLLVGMTGLQHTDKEGMSAGNRDLVLERLQDFLFHVDDLRKKG